MIGLNFSPINMHGRIHVVCLGEKSNHVTIVFVLLHVGVWAGTPDGWQLTFIFSSRQKNLLGIVDIRNVMALIQVKVLLIFFSPR